VLEYWSNGRNLRSLIYPFTLQYSIAPVLHCFDGFLNDRRTKLAHRPSLRSGPGQALPDHGGVFLREIAASRQ